MCLRRTGSFHKFASPFRTNYLQSDPCWLSQAPIHTQSLVVLGFSKKDDQEKDNPALVMETPSPSSGVDPVPGGREPDFSERALGVVEQRVSNLVQGSLCLVLMTGSFLHVLHLIPRGEVDPLFAWLAKPDHGRS